MVRIDPRYLSPQAHGLPFQSPVVRRLKPNDKLVSAADYKDPPARLTAREAEFCKLLIDLAAQLESASIPIIFEAEDGQAILDKGCIKFAEHRGFIKRLENNHSGVVSHLVVNFNV